MLYTLKRHVAFAEYTVTNLQSESIQPIKVELGLEHEKSSRLYHMHTKLVSIKLFCENKGPSTQQWICSWNDKLFCRCNMWVQHMCYIVFTLRCLLAYAGYFSDPLSCLRNFFSNSCVDDFLVSVRSENCNVIRL